MASPVMKKRTVYIPIAVIALIALGLTTFYLASRAPFRFLQGHTCSRQLVRQYFDSSDCHDFYSFPGDFNTVCTTAAAELKSLNFKEDLSLKTRDYCTTFAKEDYIVTLLNGEVLSEQATIRKPDRVPAPGYVTVCICYSKSNTHIWHHLKTRLFK
jgi:hypothetical protein